MESDLLKMVEQATPGDYMDGKKYLRDLKATYRLLQDPNTANFFGKWKPSGNTVGELVQHMIDNGLMFAPALPVDQPYYTSLYQTMLNYDTGLNQMVARYPGR
jgi:hypothetical protein